MHSGKAATLPVLQLGLVEQEIIHILLDKLRGRKLLCLPLPDLLSNVVGSVGSH